MPPQINKMPPKFEICCVFELFCVYNIIQLSNGYYMSKSAIFPKINTITNVIFILYNSSISN